MARVRSPNYPQVSLPEAISRVAQVFMKEHRHPAPKEVVVQHLGYGGVNGASLGTLSALSKYGLLERDGDDYRVSDRAIAILHPESDAEKAEAIREASQSPALFSELLGHFQGRLPSDENLRSYLVRRGFAPNSLDGVISVLRDTMEFVSTSGAGDPIIPALPAPPAQAGGHVQRAVFVSHSAKAPPPPPLESAPAQRVAHEWRVSMTENGLEVIADLADQKAVARLIAILQANQVLLPPGGDSPSARPGSSFVPDPMEDDSGA